MSLRVNNMIKCNLVRMLCTNIATISLGASSGAPSLNQGEMRPWDTAVRFVLPCERMQSRQRTWGTSRLCPVTNSERSSSWFRDFSSCTVMPLPLDMLSRVSPSFDRYGLTLKAWHWDVRCLLFEVQGTPASVPLVIACQKQWMFLTDWLITSNSPL